MIPTTVAEAKSLARALRAALPVGIDLSHGQCLDVVSRVAGVADWNALAAALRAPGTGAAMPILRVTDAEAARAFYVGVLGFEVAFEHRFAAGLPAFLGIRRDETTIGLSEHHGDGTPGSVVWLPTRALGAYRDGVVAAARGSIAPGIDVEAPGGQTMTVVDPFGNELRFCEPRRDAA